jgi:hypothetical protein
MLGSLIMSHLTYINSDSCELDSNLILIYIYIYILAFTTTHHFLNLIKWDTLLSWQNNEGFVRYKIYHWCEVQINTCAGGNEGQRNVGDKRRNSNAWT